MGVKRKRLEVLKSLLSSKEFGGQVELLSALEQEGIMVTQATLSRDLKQLKVAKAASLNGNYVYVLPNDTMYKRKVNDDSVAEMMQYNGFISLAFSGNMAVIKTRPGYASRLAYDIDSKNYFEILGTIAGDDTILMIIREKISHRAVKNALVDLIPDIL
jgi:transcriptional regulator of arginine metabolism